MRMPRSVLLCLRPLLAFAARSNASRAGGKVYAACGGSDANSPGANEVTVIDTATNTVAGHIKAGDGPWGIAVSKQ